MKIKLAVLVAFAFAISSCASAFVASNSRATVALDASPEFPETMLSIARLQLKILREKAPFEAGAEAAYQSLLRGLDGGGKIAFYMAKNESELASELGAVAYAGDYDDGEGTTGHLVIGSTDSTLALAWSNGGDVSLFVVPRT